MCSRARSSRRCCASAARRPLFLIDLAVPRDFEPSINLLDDVYLYDIDDLQSIAQGHLRERQTEIVRSVEILKPHVERYMDWASAAGRRGADVPTGGSSSMKPSFSEAGAARWRWRRRGRSWRNCRRRGPAAISRCT